LVRHFYMHCLAENRIGGTHENQLKKHKGKGFFTKLI